MQIAEAGPLRHLLRRLTRVGALVNLPMMTAGKKSKKSIAEISKQTDHFLESGPRNEGGASGPKTTATTAITASQRPTLP